MNRRQLDLLMRWCCALVPIGSQDTTTAAYSLRLKLEEELIKLWDESPSNAHSECEAREASLKRQVENLESVCGTRFDRNVELLSQLDTAADIRTLEFNAAVKAAAGHRLDAVIFKAKLEAALQETVSKTARVAELTAENDRLTLKIASAREFLTEVTRGFYGPAPANVLNHALELNEKLK
jgi:hypothetical protein